MSDFEKLVVAFSKLKEVNGIMLGGSRATGEHDNNSDYDLYIYCNSTISPKTRDRILKPLCSYIELNNQFWETEDDCIIRDTNTPIDIIYRDIKWVDEILESQLFQYQSYTGYTTCVWYNIINSNILYEKKSLLSDLKHKFQIPYPEKLRQSIIDKNRPLLKEYLPAYLSQIEKAVKRGDLLSINHRLAEFFATYFDILFALNRLPHPGEKRMLEYILKHGTALPEQIEKNIEEILTSAFTNPKEMVLYVTLLIDRLEVII